ncbi:MAG: hypothetical protein HUJ31_01765, partial [Pseudomonadales bacterium]|nr:hypothetical protein [Pseudomonadales bacterium]
MRRTDTLGGFAAVSLLLVSTMLFPGPATAAEEADMEEVVVTGTRKEGLSPTETLSPIDVIDGASLDDQATFGLTEGLTKVAPS